MQAGIARMGEDYEKGLPALTWIVLVQVCIANVEISR